MAASSSFSFSNLFSFLLPSKPQPLSPPSFTRLPTQNHKVSDNSVSERRDEDHSSSCCSLSELSSVMNPSLAHANTLFFRTAYNVQVLVDENEPEEVLLNRFRREVMKAGVIQECRRRRFYENKREEKKRKTREAAKRKSRSRRFQSRPPGQFRQEVPTDKKEEEAGDDDDDNWDLPEVDAPYT
ncbi:hypothetical protein VNO77_16593 [Canavalia gladiata]|uniref:Uncharacterized protein n=1 Tax=Canavalia gladiata TaxID=3824 RepID=A0AAN9QHY0_CANGL